MATIPKCVNKVIKNCEKIIHQEYYFREYTNSFSVVSAITSNIKSNKIHLPYFILLFANYLDIL